ncbi:MAG: hypothetical protein A2V73_07750 [candidate division Zixibacteria bacterium RBG_19FT_COMBO_42_43]|nr:MAG: hypothetical protein A2V73_07750 [candidate division Zixibacteria bacterium RBG_19FT_COMBO_42_43]
MQPRTCCKLFLFLKRAKFQKFYSHNQNKLLSFFVKNFFCFFENFFVLKILWDFNKYSKFI